MEFNLYCSLDSITYSCVSSKASVSVLINGHNCSNCTGSRLDSMRLHMYSTCALPGVRQELGNVSPVFYLSVYLFLQYWGLNSGLCPC
jgi:hypothetical protein